MSDMNVLLVQPGSYPKAVNIDSGLESLQAAVGGSIEVVYPFDDNVGLIMNEEGKIEGLPLNRALRDEQGELYDIIAGDFLVYWMRNPTTYRLSVGGTFFPVKT